MHCFVRILTIAFVGFIVWAIYQANSGAESVFAQYIRGLPYGDKMGHFLLFGLLTLLINGSLRFRRIRIGSFSLLLGSVLVLVFVAIEEASQGLLPTRSMDIHDFYADCAGIWLFSLISLQLASLSEKAESK